MSGCPMMKGVGGEWGDAHKQHRQGKQSLLSATTKRITIINVNQAGTPETLNPVHIPACLNGG